MTTPREPFQYTEDTVAARVSVDVPNESVASLNQLVAKAQELRTHVEASARAQASFDEYLRQLPQLLDQANQAQGRMENVVTPGQNVEGSSADPFSDDFRPSGSRRRSARERGRELREEGSAPRSASEIEEEIRILEREDPRQAANMRAQREGGGPRRDSAPDSGASSRPGAPPRPGRGRPSNRPDSSDNSSPDAPEQNRPDRNSPGEQPQRDWVRELQTRASQGQGFVSQVLNETRMGNSSPLGNAAFAARSLGQAAQGVGDFAQQRVDAQTAAYNQQMLADHIAQGGTEETFTPHVLPPGAAGLMGRLPGMMGTVGKAAGVLGAGVTLAVASQSVGEQYQQYKNQGMVRGGGFSEGIGYEGQIRALALNPFISTEQSRQLITSALSEGYTGKEFDTVTQFMAENLKNMNMSVAESMKLVNQQMVQGGQSVLGFAKQMSTIKGLSDEGYATFDDRKAIYEATAGQMVQSGTSGDLGGSMGQLAGQIYSDNKLMEGQGQALTGSLLSPQGGLAVIRELGLDRATIPGNAVETAEAEGYSAEEITAAGAKGLEKMLLPIAQRWAAARDRGDSSMQTTQESIAINVATQFGLQPVPNKQQIRVILEQVLNGEFSGQVGAAQSALTQEEQKVDDRQQSGNILRTGVGNISKGLMNVIPGVGQGLQQLGVDPSHPMDSLNNLGNAGAIAVTGIGDALEGAAGFLGFGDGNEDWESTRAATKEFTTEKDNAAARFSNPRLQNLVTQYGTSIKVKDEKGNETTLDQNNKEQVAQVLSGNAQIKTSDDAEWTTLGNLEGSQENEQFGGEGGGGANVQIDLTPAAKQLVSAINTGSGRTVNQQNADTGRANGQNNNTGSSEGRPWTLPGLGGN
jgi:hypothetical protein